MGSPLPPGRSSCQIEAVLRFEHASRYVMLLDNGLRFDARKARTRVDYPSLVFVRPYGDHGDAVANGWALEQCLLLSSGTWTKSSSRAQQYPSDGRSHRNPID